LRHRVSKLRVRYWRVYGGGRTWKHAHRRWLAAQRFDYVATELAYLDALGSDPISRSHKSRRQNERVFGIANGEKTPS
jgi:hypothetical protein